MIPGITASGKIRQLFSGAFISFFLLLTLTSNEVFSQAQKDTIAKKDTIVQKDSTVKKDTIFFKDGSIMVGKIKKIKLGVVTFDPSDANDITVKLLRLRTMAAVRKVFRIETVDKKAYYGKLLPADTNYVRVTPGVDSLLYLEDISVLTPYGNSVLQRLSGNVGVGYNYTRSSNFGRLNYNTNVVYTTQRDEISVSASGIYSMTDTSFTRDNENLSLKYNNYFTPTWFVTILASYQRNLELGLERRFQQGLGIGGKFLKKRSVYAWSRSGAVINQERSTEDVKTGPLTELYTQLEFNFFKLARPAFTFDVSQAFYYNLSQSGRFRNDGRVDISWDIISDFKMTLGFFNNFDSQPPTEGSRKFDFGINFGVNYIF
jgi:hypothetical protein